MTQVPTSLVSIHATPPTNRRGTANLCQITKEEKYQCAQSLFSLRQWRPSRASAKAQQIDWKRVDAALGRPAAVTGDVHRYGLPRNDLHVTLDGVTIKPALALGGWVAFKPTQDGAMMMGDLVLLEAEITPVMTAAIQNGLEVTAIHNHILRADPATFYMHVSGHGDPIKLANALHKALASSKTPLTAPAASAASPQIALDTAELDHIIGVKRVRLLVASISLQSPVASPPRKAQCH